MAFWTLLLVSVSALPALAADLTSREVTFPGAYTGNEPLPAFDKSYLLFIKHPCRVAVHAPDGRLLFDRTLQIPGASTCSSGSAAVDTDGVVAVTAGYLGPNRYAGGIVLLDPAGNQTRFIDTQRYMPSQICFDRNHAIWTIGWQRDAELNDHADKNDYPIVHKYSRDGKQMGAYIPRNQWSRKGEPGTSGVGLWHIAAANDRIGALIYESHADHRPELIEWDLEGNLIARTPLPRPPMDGGRAYTASARLYARLYDSEAKQHYLALLDKDTGKWSRVEGDVSGLLLGADGDDLVYKAPYSGSVRLLWFHPPHPD
jgi:YD repeat-containing protein